MPDKEYPVPERDAKMLLISDFKRQCEEICTNEEELCDILVDLCYRTERSKQFVWDICGDVILKNLLRRKGNIVHYPELTHGEGDFEYCGEHFVMKEKIIDDQEINFK